MQTRKFTPCGPLCFYSPSQNYNHPLPQASTWTTLRKPALTVKKNVILFLFGLRTFQHSFINKMSHYILYIS